MVFSSVFCLLVFLFSCFCSMMMGCFMFCLFVLFVIFSSCFIYNFMFHVCFVKTKQNEQTSLFILWFCCVISTFVGGCKNDASISESFCCPGFELFHLWFPCFCRCVDVVFGMSFENDCRGFRESLFTVALVGLLSNAFQVGDTIVMQYLLSAPFKRCFCGPSFPQWLAFNFFVGCQFSNQSKQKPMNLCVFVS